MYHGEGKGRTDSLVVRLRRRLTDWQECIAGSSAMPQLATKASKATQHSPLAVKESCTHASL